MMDLRRSKPGPEGALARIQDGLRPMASWLMGEESLLRTMPVRLMAGLGRLRAVSPPRGRGWRARVRERGESVEFAVFVGVARGISW